MGVSLYRPVTLFWRLKRHLTSFQVPSIKNHRIIGNEIQIWDDIENDYSPIGLDNGAFAILNGSGNNYVIEYGILKFLDINDSQYYPIGLENKAFVVLQGTGEINYKLEPGLLSLYDIGEKEYHAIMLLDGSFAVIT